MISIHTVSTLPNCTPAIEVNKVPKQLPKGQLEQSETLKGLSTAINSIN